MESPLPVVLCLHDLAEPVQHELFPAHYRRRFDFVLNLHNQQFLEEMETCMANPNILQLFIYVGETSTKKRFPIKGLTPQEFINRCFNTACQNIVIILNCILQFDDIRLPFISDSLFQCAISQDVPAWPNRVTVHSFRSQVPLELVMGDEDDDLFPFEDELESPHIYSTIKKEIHFSNGSLLNESFH